MVKPVLTHRNSSNMQDSTITIILLRKLRKKTSHHITLIWCTYVHNLYLTSLPMLVKIDREMRPWECTQTDTQIHWQT